MKNNRLLQGFILTIVVALLLRVFVIDVISVSNEALHPHFFPGDFLLISKLSSASEGQWVLLKNYPHKSYYSIRQLLEKKSDLGWTIAEPQAVITGETADEMKQASVENRQIVGKAVLVLWSLPCKPAASASAICSEKVFRYFKAID